MEFQVYILLYSTALFFGLVASLKIGHILGRKHRPREKDNGGNALDGVVFALVGLLLAFCFSFSVTSFNNHRVLLTKEANDMSEAFTKLDLLPPEDQSRLRSLMLEYAEARLIASSSTKSSEEEQEALTRSRYLQDVLWTEVIASMKKSPHETVYGEIVRSFSIMANGPGDQLADERDHMPDIIYILMFVLAILAALIAGYGMSKEPEIPPLRIFIFSFSVVITVYVIADLEYPRSGLFLSDGANQTLQEVVEDMRRMQLPLAQRYMPGR